MWLPTHQISTHCTIFGCMLSPKPAPPVLQISKTSRTHSTNTGMPCLRTISATGSRPSMPPWKPSLLPRVH
uniref:Uncharacterized protein n=1 Tax=Lepeophtheirus salmonis TaxID=72036 RepID=A0A0K2UHD9_LEPSM